MSLCEREHGGPHALGVAAWDFSTNANACGPCPAALEAVCSADASHYPDPSYQELRAALAALHGVDAQRVLPLASASEGIMRLTAWRWRAGDRRCWIPRHAYGDYAHAARLWGWQRTDDPAHAQLLWLCDPSSPLGQAEPAWPTMAQPAWPQRTVVVDRAYEPLRLRAAEAVDACAWDSVWQLWTPNKALGLPGVRAAYAIAPAGAHAAVRELEASAPSWPIGAHGVAMLLAWTRPEVQAWVADSCHTLRVWRAQLRAALQVRAWHCADSDTPFFCARPPHALDARALRARGVQLRDASSFDLPGWWRLSAQPPQALAALCAALDALGEVQA